MKGVQQIALILLYLPDNKLVLQRRTKNAQHGAGMLGFFGGWVEDGETPTECIQREVHEETSLKIQPNGIKPLGSFMLHADNNFGKDRHFFMYESHISNMDFGIYEGDRAEAYTINELQQRDDLIVSTHHVIHKVLHT